MSSSLLDALLLDPYPVQPTQTFWIARREDNIFGSGTATDPWNAPDGDIDARMNAIVALVAAQQATQTPPMGARVILGPGNFTTRGYSDDDSAGNQSGWSPVYGLIITGSGVDVTILQLVNTSTATAQYYAIGHPLSGSSPKINQAEIADLTIDCNLPGSGSLGCGAVRLCGDSVRIRKVKAINWGSRNSTKRCFVFAVITAAPSSSYSETVNAGIQDCIALAPGSTSQPVTVFHAGGKEDVLGGSNREAFGTAPFIRNCFVDAGLSTPSPSGNLRALSMGQCRGGVVEGNQVLNVDIGGPYQDRASARDIIVRHNVYRNVARGPYFKLGTNNQPDAMTLSTLARDTSDDKTALATTSAAHGLTVGDVVKIYGSSDSDFDGFYMVRNVPTTTQFKFQRATAFHATAPTTPGNARKLLSVGKLLLSDNYLELTPEVSPIAIEVDDGGSGTDPEAPDYIYSEVVIRGNQLRYLDGPIPTASGDVAIRVNGARKFIVGDNLIESANPNPIQHARCNEDMYKPYDNLDPADFIRQAEDALMMGLMSRR